MYAEITNNLRVGSNGIQVRPISTRKTAKRVSYSFTSYLICGLSSNAQITPSPVAFPASEILLTRPCQHLP